MSFRDRIKGRYAIEAKLGAGSFGEVYTCWDTKKSRNDDDIKVIKVSRQFGRFFDKTKKLRSFTLETEPKLSLMQMVSYSLHRQRKPTKMLNVKRKY